MRPIFTAPPAPGFPLLRLRPPHAPASTVVAPDMPTSRSTFLRSYVAISDYLSLDLLLGRQLPQHRIFRGARRHDRAGSSPESHVWPTIGPCFPRVTVDVWAELAPTRGPRASRRWRPLSEVSGRRRVPPP